ncbi:hypothetical protein [Paenibacillus piscarius]|uniref:hypothetical protein n=1 Tax=Paenibacillus piscarius TaxID=1089681 RepID=UPI001EE7E6F3|nr:hypothetical protein [Paenibacillus piscarius]
MKLNPKKLSATLAVIACTGGMLAASGFVVPGLVNSAVVAKSSAAMQGYTKQGVADSTVPVLKVEAPAPVSTVNDDLIKQMTKEQIQQIYDYLELPGDPKTSGREMTEAEMNRRLVLDDQYVYDGLRPKKLLPLQAGQGDLYLDIKTNTYHYPERAWTDEELLQLIDWSYRTNLLASKRSIIAPTVAVPQKYSEAELKTRASESVRKLFDADVSKLKTNVMLLEPGYGIPSTWAVGYEPYKALTLRGQGQEFWQYHVQIDPDTGVVLDTTVFNSVIKRTPIDAAAAAAIKKDKSWVNTAVQIVKDKQGEKRKIVKASLTDMEVNNKRGMVAVDIVLEDGSKYNAELRYPSKMLRCLIYEPAGKAK